MSLSLTPNICYTPAIFYDRNHNPLNIPCEGPKVYAVSFVKGQLNAMTKNDPIIQINFNQLFTSGQMTAVQSMAVGGGQGYTPSVIGISFAGLGQEIVVGNNTSLSSPGQVIAIPTMHVFPITVLNPAQILINLYQFVSDANSGSNNKVNFQFYNYMHPSFIEGTVVLTPGAG